MEGVLTLSGEKVLLGPWVDALSPPCLWGLYRAAPVSEGLEQGLPPTASVTPVITINVIMGWVGSALVEFSFG